MAFEVDEDSFLRILVRYLDKDRISVSDRDLPPSRSDAAVRTHASILLDVLVHDALGQALDQSIVTAKPLNRRRLEKVRAQIAAMPYTSSDFSNANYVTRQVAMGLNECSREAHGIKGAEATAAAIERAAVAARLLGLVNPTPERVAHALGNSFEGSAHALDKYKIKGTTGKQSIAAVVQRGLDTCSAVSNRESAAESPVLVTFSRDLGMMIPLSNTGASFAVEETRAHLLLSFALCRLLPMLWRRMYDSGAYDSSFTGPPPLRPTTEAKVESLTTILNAGKALDIALIPIANQHKDAGEMQEKVALAMKAINQAYVMYFGEMALFHVTKEAVPRVMARQIALATKYAMEAGVNADDLTDAARETIALGMVLH